MYYLTEPGVVGTSEVFAAKAAEAGIDFELKLRETAGPNGLEADYENLVAAKSNVYIFFGGSHRLARAFKCCNESEASRASLDIAVQGGPFRAVTDIRRMFLVSDLTALQASDASTTGRRD